MRIRIHQETDSMNAEFMQGAPVAVAGAGVAAAGVASVAGFEQMVEVVGAAAVAQLAFKRLFSQSDRGQTIAAIRWASNQWGFGDFGLTASLACLHCETKQDRDMLAMKKHAA